jgi:hypothetical protein
MEFKNSFYNVAVEAVKKNGKTASGQIELIDNFTSNAPLLASIPFQKASNNYHHVYSRLLDADNLQVVDFDGRLPTLRAQSQLEKVDLTPFGGSFEFGEDLMLQSHGNAKDYLADQIPPVLRKTGMELERSLYINNFLTKTIAYETMRSAHSAASAENHYPTMVAVTWEPGEMTGLYSPLPYGSGDRFGKLFETEWANDKARHKLESGVYGYAATIKIFIGILLANKQKISSLVNIVGTPSAKQLAALVNAANSNGSTRIYCSAALKTSIAAAFARVYDGNGLVSVTGAGEVSVLGVPIVTSNNIPQTIGFIDAPVIEP